MERIIDGLDCLLNCPVNLVYLELKEGSEGLVAALDLLMESVSVNESGEVNQPLESALLLVDLDV